MMLPTDIALTTDAAFKAHVERYAKDEAAFRSDFKLAFEKLVGAPAAPVHSLPPPPQP